MENSFTDLSANQDAIYDVLRRMDLIAPDDVVMVTPLTGGVSSNILKITTPDREFCIKQALPTLKVAKEWHAPLERVFAEIDWMQTVGALFPNAVPNIIAVDKTALCFAMDYLPAENYANWKSQLLNGEVDLQLAEKLGEVLVGIHAHTAMNSELAQRFAYDDNFLSLRLDPYLGEISRIHPDYADIIRAILVRTQHTQLALVHGDISPKNILRGPHGPVILDAECAWYGDPAFDLAFCLNHFLLKTLVAESADRQGQLLSAFQVMNEKYLAGVSWESADEFEARIATLLPCLILARIDGKSPVEYLNAQQASTVRHAACQLLDARFTRLKDIQAFWKEEVIL